MERANEYMTIELWTLIVAIATLIISVLAYCLARKSSKTSQKQIESLREQQKDFFDKYIERVKAEDKKKIEEAEFMSSVMAKEAERMKALFNNYTL